MYNLWVKPQTFFANEIEVTPAKILLMNLFLVSLSVAALSSIVPTLLEESNLLQIVVTILFIFALSIPLYYLMNAIISSVFGFIAITFEKHIPFAKVYSVIVSANTLVFICNAISLSLLLLFTSHILFYIASLFSVVVGFFAIRIFYYGLLHYVGYKKSFAKVCSVAVFLLSTAATLMGGIYYATYLSS